MHAIKDTFLNFLYQQGNNAKKADYRLDFWHLIHLYHRFFHISLFNRSSRPIKAPKPAIWMGDTCFCDKMVLDYNFGFFDFGSNRASFDLNLRYYHFKETI